jgi:hypothetical protein
MVIQMVELLAVLWDLMKVGMMAIYSAEKRVVY